MKVSTLRTSYREDDNCAPKQNFVLRRFNFFSRQQNEGESIASFVCALKKLASKCNFLERDSLLRDRIVFGVRDKALQEHLLQVGDIKLDKAIKLATAAELGHLEGLVIGDQTNVNEVCKLKPEAGNTFVPKTAAETTKKFRQYFSRSSPNYRQMHPPTHNKSEDEGEEGYLNLSRKCSQWDPFFTAPGDSRIRGKGIGELSPNFKVVMTPKTTPRNPDCVPKPEAAVQQRNVYKCGSHSRQLLPEEPPPVGNKAEQTPPVGKKVEKATTAEPPEVKSISANIRQRYKRVRIGAIVVMLVTIILLRLLCTYYAKPIPEENGWWLFRRKVPRSYKHAIQEIINKLAW